MFVIYLLYEPYNSMYTCSMMFYLNCIESMVVCDFLFLVMLILYSLITHIEI